MDRSDWHRVVGEQLSLVVRSGCQRPSSSFLDLDHDGDNQAEGDDIYIMMKCLSVCLFVTKNEHFLVGFHGFQDSFRVFHGFSR